MASSLELTKNYNLQYAFWAWIEYHFDWDNPIAQLAMRRMNEISLKKKGKEVFMLGK